jgi:hypothetical protein
VVAGPPPPPFEIESGVALLASVAGRDFAPSVLAEVAIRRPDASAAIGLGVLAVGAHTIMVGPASAAGPGQANWRRIGGVLDVRSLLRGSKVSLAAAAGFALTALEVAGQTYPVTSTATLIDPGFVVGLRASFRAGGFSPWLEAACAAWPRTHTVSVTGTGRSADLPGFEAFFGGGVTLGHRP